MTYKELYQNSIENPEQFWAEAASDIDWSRQWDRVLDDSDPPFYEWFAGGEINTCYNALDRHCEAGRGGQAALIYDSPVTGQGRTYSYEELRDEVAVFANVLQMHGVSKGDRVIICCYARLSQHEVANFKPTLVYLDGANQVIRTSNQIPVQVA